MPRLCEVVLNLGENEIGAAGARCLAGALQQLAGMSRLELNLEQNQLGAAGAQGVASRDGVTLRHLMTRAPSPPPSLCFIPLRLTQLLCVLSRCICPCNHLRHHA